MERRIEWEEFKWEVYGWISENPQMARRLFQEALSQIPANPGVIEEAKWAARWARVFWATAGIEPPRR